MSLKYDLLVKQRFAPTLRADVVQVVTLIAGVFETDGSR